MIISYCVRVRYVAMAATALLPLAIPAASGNDLAVFELIGFSPSGDHLAWGQYGIQDGSGFPWASIRVISVPTGEQILDDSWIYRFDEEEFFSTPVPEDYGPEHLTVEERALRYWERYAWEVLRDSLRTTLDSIGIAEGNLGLHCLHHPMTDLTDWQGDIRFTTGMLAPWYYSGPELVLRIELPPAASGEDASLVYGYGYDLLPRVLRLELRDASTDSLLFELDDTPLADITHYWAYDYAVRDVFAYRDEVLAIVLRKSVPGFEGPDVRYRVVVCGMPQGRQEHYP